MKQDAANKAFFYLPQFWPFSSGGTPNKPRFWPFFVFFFGGCGAEDAWQHVCALRMCAPFSYARRQCGQEKCGTV